MSRGRPSGANVMADIAAGTNVESDNPYESPRSGATPPPQDGKPRFRTSHMLLWTLTGVALLSGVNGLSPGGPSRKYLDAFTFYYTWGLIIGCGAITGAASYAVSVWMPTRKDLVSTTDAQGDKRP